MEDYRECADVNNGSKYKHSRTIIHIDLDCFYAQVEMLKNSELATKPIGIKQQHYVITSNYVARAYGIKKCMLITEALSLCPNLILINGEDLHDYRVWSAKVTDVIKHFGCKVEKLGLDENFIDVSHLVDTKINKIPQIPVITVQGHIYRNEMEINCTCGCKNRLSLGSHIAEEIRNEIRKVLGLTCCAGIAHNKLLAKLVCPTHKPNQQTTVFPSSATTLVSNLRHLRSIPGIGRKTSDILDVLNIRTVIDLQNCSLTLLEKHLDKTLANWIKGACFGVDDSDVKESGRQQIIGLEEASKSIIDMVEVKNRIFSLVERGLILVEEDGRHPTTLRVVVRKYSSSSEYSRQRESKQCTINKSLFKSKDKDRICEIALGLFKKLVDEKKPFHLTLIGIAFTNFQNVLPVEKSLLRFINKECDKKLSTSYHSKESQDSCDFTKNQSQFFHSDEFENSATSKAKFEKIDRSVLDELPTDIQVEILQKYPDENIATPSTSCSESQCPLGVDISVFNELPKDIQVELLRNLEGKKSNKMIAKRQKTILNYFKQE